MIDFESFLRKKIFQKKKFLFSLSLHQKKARAQNDATRCKWCKSKIRSSSSNVPVFGIQFKDNGEVYVDPLKDDEAIMHFHTFGAVENEPKRREGYAGFICCGKFHRFSTERAEKDGAEQVWTWIRERARTHYGIWKRNTGLYLKELEWKYNNKSLEPEDQAKKIILLMPMSFLTTWAIKT